MMGLADASMILGGGLWMPEAQALAAMRRDIDRKPHKIKRVLTDAGLRKHFFGGVADDERQGVKAFVEQNAENALKTRPKVSPSHFLRSTEWYEDNGTSYAQATLAIAVSVGVAWCSAMRSHRAGAVIASVVCALTRCVHHTRGTTGHSMAIHVGVRHYICEVLVVACRD